MLNNTQVDGEYSLKITNRKVKVGLMRITINLYLLLCLMVLFYFFQIYCSGMQSDNPKEYITLVKGEGDNFSEVFGYRYLRVSSALQVG